MFYSRIILEFRFFSCEINPFIARDNIADILNSETDSSGVVCLALLDWTANDHSLKVKDII